MRITLSVIKADIGSIGGHTSPSPEVVDIVQAHVPPPKRRRRRACTALVRTC
jgi:fructose 1,6-bisphosphatase